MRSAGSRIDSARPATAWSWVHPLSAPAAKTTGLDFGAGTPLMVWEIRDGMASRPRTFFQSLDEALVAARGSSS